MSNRTFKTSAVLAAMRAFPVIIVAREEKDIENNGIIEAFDELRKLSPKIAGIEWPTDHSSWCELSQAMRPVLRQHFAALASESLPDSKYWAMPDDIDEDKIERLREWTIAMEEKYGATLEVPDISDEVLENLTALDFKILRLPDASLRWHDG